MDLSVTQPDEGYQGKVVVESLAFQEVSGIERPAFGLDAEGLFHQRHAVTSRTEHAMN